MIPPIVVIDEGGLEVYESAAAAEADVESPEVEAGLVQAYDSVGRALSFDVIRPSSSGRWTVDIVPLRLGPVEDEPRHAESLRRALIDALSALGETLARPEDLDPAELMEKASRRLGVTKLRPTMRQAVRKKMATLLRRAGRADRL